MGCGRGEGDSGQITASGPRVPCLYHVDVGPIAHMSPPGSHPVTLVAGLLTAPSPFPEPVSRWGEVSSLPASLCAPQISSPEVLSGWDLPLPFLFTWACYWHLHKAPERY